MSHEAASGGACLACGGACIIAGVNGLQGMHFFYPPDGSVKPLILGVQARICTQCGYTALYVPDMERVRGQIAYITDLAVERAARAESVVPWEARRAARKAESRGGKPAYPSDKTIPN